MHRELVGWKKGVPSKEWSRMVEEQGSVPCGLCFGHSSQLPKPLTKEDASATTGLLLTSDNDHEQILKFTLRLSYERTQMINLQLFV